MINAVWPTRKTAKSADIDFLSCYLLHSLRYIDNISLNDDL